MGGTPSSQLDTQNLDIFLQSLEYIIEKQTPHFGEIKIYKMTEKPYEYLMRKTYHGLANDPILLKKYEYYRTLEEDKNSVTIDFIKMVEKENACGKTSELSIFCKYYYFTLRDALQKKIMKRTCFFEEEVIYIAQTLLHLHQQFHRTTNEYLGFFKSHMLFLTPQGFLKVYPTINQWSKEYEQAKITINEQSNFLTTDEIETVVNLSTPKFDSDTVFIKSERDDLRDIGIVLLEVLTLTKNQDYWHKGKGEIKEELVQFILENGNNKQLNTFRSFLKGILQYNWSSDRAHKQLETLIEKNMLKKSFCLRLPNSENDDSPEPSQRQQFFEQLKKSRLSQLETSQLCSSRITPISILSKKKKVSSEESGILN